MSKGQETGLVDVALMAKREKRRAEWRKAVKKRKTEPATKHAQAIKANEKSTSSAPCFVCQKRIRFEVETLTGRLIRLNLDGSRHVHQDG